jgi:type IV secretory pathway TrbL component
MFAAQLLPQEVADIVTTTYASLSSSVRYLGASALSFSMNAACSFSLSFGGGVVRVATGTPTSMKNSSCPAGEQIQSMRTAPLEVL